MDTRGNGRNPYTTELCGGPLWWAMEAISLLRNVSHSPAWPLLPTHIFLALLIITRETMKANVHLSPAWGGKSSLCSQPWASRAQPPRSCLGCQGTRQQPLQWQTSSWWLCTSSSSSLSGYGWVPLGVGFGSAWAKKLWYPLDSSWVQRGLPANGILRTTYPRACGANLRVTGILLWAFTSTPRGDSCGITPWRLFWEWCSTPVLHTSGCGQAGGNRKVKVVLEKTKMRP